MDAKNRKIEKRAAGGLTEQRRNNWMVAKGRGGEAGRDSSRDREGKKDWESRETRTVKDREGKGEWGSRLPLGTNRLMNGRSGPGGGWSIFKVVSAAGPPRSFVAVSRAAGPDCREGGRRSVTTHELAGTPDWTEEVRRLMARSEPDQETNTARKSPNNPQQQQTLWERRQPQ